MATDGTQSTVAPSTTLVAGVDRLQIVVDYGPNIHFTKTATVPAPTIAVFTDGQPTAVTLQLSSAQRGKDGRVYFVAEFPVPATLTRNLTITVTVAPSFQWQVPVIFQTTSAVPSLSVFRRSSDKNGTCYEDLTAGEQKVDGWLLDQAACDSPPGNSTAPQTVSLVAGIDQLLLLADYGSGLLFDSAAVAPVPLFGFLVDGVPSGAGITSIAHLGDAGRVYFTANVTAPAAPSDHVRISASAAAGAGFNRVSKTEFKATLIAPAFTLLRWSEELNCYGNMAANEVPIDVDVMNAVGEICPVPASQAMKAGIDRLAVLVDFGATLPFAHPAAVPVPTATLIIDGQASSTAIRLASPQVTKQGRAYFFSSTQAPAAAADDVALSLALPGGFATQLITHFSILPVEPQLEVVGCEDPSKACELVAGVGNATVLVRVPGAQSRSVTLRTSVTETTLLALTATTVDTTIVGDHSEGRLTLRVPETGEGALWSIDAVLDGRVEKGPEIALHAPIPTATLDCRAPCALSTGDMIGLTVSAPAEIHASQAFLTQRLNGGLLGSTTAIDLAAVDLKNQTRSGVIQLTAPSKPGSWTIDVSVNGYVTQRAQATVQTPPSTP